ncbi:ferritin-like domain-containing protein [Prauserella alba]|uniref:ferritin-like domain-containing protein n=2 Tax=Prauserella alba TaxID=176898 RepID=UPI0020A60D85|nr:ferritin-like domain-containing protein [Prauserella alba]
MLRGAALALPAVAGLGAVAGCTDYDDSPDALLPLLNAAEADTAAARALGGSAAEQVAAVRAAQARALRREVNRLNRPRATATSAPPTTAGGPEELGQRLGDARDRAVRLVPRLPAYRAGLAGAVAAGCAAAQQLDEAFGAGQPGPLQRVSAGPLDEPAVGALQQALATEHAAEWVYTTVTAFLPGSYDNGLTEGGEAHRDRRLACERLLRAAGATPRTAEPAYTTENPVSDQDSAVRLVVGAETDATRSWHGVLERTEDPGLRGVATQALVGSATRCTSWRLDAGATPAAIALPGRG